MTSLRLSQEEKNFWRFCMLNKRTVAAALRNYFDKIIPPQHLTKVINKNMNVILKLVKKRVISSSQEKILQGIPGTAWPQRMVNAAGSGSSSKDLDVTLMICLIRNLTQIKPPINGWETLPQPHEKTAGAYIATVKFFRNQLAHAKDTTMGNIEFQNNWKIVLEAVTFFCGGTPPNNINEIINLDMDGSQAAITIEMLTSENEMIKNELSEAKDNLKDVQDQFKTHREGTLPHNVNANIEETVRRWDRDEEVFCETRATEAAKEALDSSNILIISGNSGSGKSAAARHLALHLLSQGFNIVPVDSVREIIEYRCKSIKQVFIIDDVVGKYNVDKVKINEWENEKLKTIFESKDVILLCTLRKIITECGHFTSSSTLLKSKSVLIDFDSYEYKLSKEEKYAMLQTHLRKHNKESDLSENEMLLCCKGTIAFPLNCRLFVSNSRWFDKKEQFFYKPVIFLKDELTKMYNRNKEIYCVLVLCMIFSGKLPTELLDVSSDLDSKMLQKKAVVMKSVIEACGLPRNISREVLLNSIQSVQGLYIDNLTIKYYKFIHDSIFEVVSCHFSSVQPKVFIQHCDVRFLCSRVRLYDPEKDDDECVIVIHKEKEIYLISKFVQEVKKGMFVHILGSQPIKDERFVQLFGRYIKEEGISKIDLLNTSISDVYDRLFLVDCRSIELIQTITRKKSSYFVLKHSMLGNYRYLLYWIVASDCFHLFLFFWNKMSRREQNDYRAVGFRSYFKGSLLPLALLNGNLKMIEVIFEYCNEIKCPVTQHVITKFVKEGTHMEILQYLLENNVKLNFIDQHKKTVLFYAMVSAQSEMQRMIMSFDILPGSILEAVFLSDFEKVSSVISTKNIYEKTSYGWTVFHIAAFNNDITMMKYLLKEIHMNDRAKHLNLKYCRGEIKNIKDITGMTPLHVATIMNCYEIVKVLIEEGTPFQNRDNCGNKPFDYCKNDKIAVQLVEYELRGYESESTKIQWISESFSRSIEGANSEHVSDSTVVVIDQHDESVADNRPMASSWHTLCSIIFNFQFFVFTTQFFRPRIDKADANGDTMLHKTTTSGCDEAFEKLLKKGANIYIYNNDYDLPLHKSAETRAKHQQIDEIIKHIALQDRRNLFKIFVCLCIAFVILNTITSLMLKLESPEHGPMQYFIILWITFSLVILFNFVLKSVKVNIRHFFFKEHFSIFIYLLISPMLIVVSVADVKNHLSSLIINLTFIYLINAFVLCWVEICNQSTHANFQKTPFLHCARVLGLLFAYFVLIYAGGMIQGDAVGVSKIGAAFCTFSAKTSIISFILSIFSMIIYVMCLPQLMLLYELSLYNSLSKKSQSKKHIRSRKALFSFCILSLFMFDLILTLIMLAF